MVNLFSVDRRWKACWLIRSEIYEENVIILLQTFLVNLNKKENSYIVFRINA